VKIRPNPLFISAFVSEGAITEQTLTILVTEQTYFQKIHLFSHAH